MEDTKMRLDFEVTGSRGDPYQITFEKISNTLRAFCSCKAGQNGQFCKHRESLMSGDVSNLISDNSDDVCRLHALMAETDINTAFNEFVAAKRQTEIADEAYRNARKALARAMKP